MLKRLLPSRVPIVWRPADIISMDSLLAVATTLGGGEERDKVVIITGIFLTSHTVLASCRLYIINYIYIWWGGGGYTHTHTHTELRLSSLFASFGLSVNTVL